jgi:MYXO-CTERM domain-containing protein
MLYAHWFGNANGAFGLGVYGLNIAFQPTGTPVPLPTSLILLLSGLGMLWGWQRRPEAA